MKNQTVVQSFTKKAVVLAVVAGAVNLTVSTRADTIYAAADQVSGDFLVSFDSASPGTLLSSHPFSGLAVSEVIEGLTDLNGTLYGLGSSDNLYTINAATGAATLVGPLNTAINGVFFSMTGDTQSRIWESSDLGQNLSINPATGTATPGPSYTGNSDEDGLAFNNNTGTMYALSLGTSSLLTLNPATGAVLTTTPLTFGGQSLETAGLTHPSGFTYSPITGNYYITSAMSGATELFTLTGVGTGSPTLTADGDVFHNTFPNGFEGITTVPEPGTAALSALGGACFLIGLLRRRK